MTGDELKTSRLVIEVSEPWELARQREEAPLVAEVAAIEPGSSSSAPSLLLELPRPVEWDGNTYLRLVAQLADQPALRALDGGDAVEAQFYGVPRDREIVDPLDVSWWRGGLGMLGSLRRT